MIKVKKVTIKDINGNTVAEFEKILKQDVTEQDMFLISGGRIEKITELEITATAENIIVATDAVKTALGLIEVIEEPEVIEEIE